jgi:hypothetical protein
MLEACCSYFQGLFGTVYAQSTFKFCKPRRPPCFFPCREAEYERCTQSSPRHPSNHQPPWIPHFKSCSNASQRSNDRISNYERPQQQHVHWTDNPSLIFCAAVVVFLMLSALIIYLDYVTNRANARAEAWMQGYLALRCPRGRCF